MGRRRDTRLLWPVTAAVLVAGLAVSLAILFRGEGGDNRGSGAGASTTATRAPATPPATRATPTPKPSVLSSRRITAKASSTFTKPPGRYEIKNTLDGRDNTAWNSDGNKVGPGPGITLTYNFGRPVHLTAITVRNGYVRSSLLGTKAFAANGRLKRVIVMTDTGGTRWQLRDTPKPQTLRTDLGTTRTVTLVVETVYQGNRFSDLALTDIAFTGTG